MRELSPAYCRNHVRTGTDSEEHREVDNRPNSCSKHRFLRSMNSATSGPLPLVEPANLACLPSVNDPLTSEHMLSIILRRVSGGPVTGADVSGPVRSGFVTGNGESRNHPDVNKLQRGSELAGPSLFWLCPSFMPAPRIGDGGRFLHRRRLKGPPQPPAAGTPEYPREDSENLHLHAGDCNGPETTMGNRDPMRVACVLVTHLRPRLR